MDALKAQHLFDVLEANLQDIKNDVLQNAENGSSYNELEDEFHDLERTVSEMEDKEEELNDKISDYQTGIVTVISKLEELLSNLEEDHPGYSTEILDDAIQTLKDL